MSNDLEKTVHRLVNGLAGHNSIRAIGISGGERPFPKAGEGDIDIFVYCTEVPASRERQEILALLQEDVEQVEIRKLEGGHWGQGDCMSIAGIETWLLYFTVAEARTELDEILAGNYLGRLDSYYYPLGRCAMWKIMRVLYDPENLLGPFKKQQSDYPQALQQKDINHHLKALEDVEDLERAVGRKDV